MTRKDYQLIAECLNKVYNDNEIESDVLTLRMLVSELSRALVKDNPRFNAEVFVKACGF